MPDIDPTQLAAMLSVGGTSRPNTVFPTEQPAPPPVDLGTGTPAGTPSSITSPLQQAANAAPAPAAGPPKQSNMPALAGYLKQVFGDQGARGYQPAAPGQPGRPVSRLDAFENFVGNFLNSFATGMQNSGTGPGAFGRGMGAAIQAPYQRQMQQYQMGQQQQAQQSQVGLQQAEAQRMRAQSEMTTITLPGGQTMQLPASQATEILKTQLQGQAKVDVAGKNRFASSPYGIYDKQTGKFSSAGAGGVAGTVKMTKEMADSGQFGPGAAQLVGTNVKISDINGMEKATSSGYGFVQGAEGPAREQKVGATGNLGLGSPASNAIAQGKLSLAQQQFERDTFGTLFGKNIPSSLIDDNGQTIGWKSPSAPTANIKTTGQQAQATLKVLDEAERQLAVANKSGKLGPGAGRLNEFLVGRVGADDPEFSALRAIVSLGMTGTLKAHFGSRAPVQMFEHFKDLLDTGKMTYGDLTASLKSFRFVLNDYARQARTAGAGEGGGAQSGGNFSPNNPFAPKKKP